MQGPAPVDPPLVAEIGRLNVARSGALRLSIPLRHRRCTAHAPTDGSVARTTCEPSRNAEIAVRAGTIAARAAREGTATPTVDALHALALVDLLWPAAAGNSADRSIEKLRRAAQLDERSTDVLVDLGAAYAARAERTQSVLDLLDALDVTMNAIDRAPNDVAARFNLAMLCDRLGLDAQAGQAWRAYVSLDGSSEWAAEARAHLGAHRSPPSATLAEDASGDAIDTFVSASPEAARSLGWDRVLGDWGAAIQSGDDRRADRLLRFATVLGERLTVHGGDGSLAIETRTIAARRGDRRFVAHLAEAHRLYAAGRAQYLAPDYRAAAETFARAAAVAPASTPLHAWAQLFAGGSLVTTGRAAIAEPMLRTLATTADTIATPALAAQARWMFGIARAWSAHHQEALALFDAAAPLFLRAGEPENAGAVQYLAGARRASLGQRGTHEQMHRALLTLRGQRPTVWQHNVLYLWPEAVISAGLPRAAALIQDEDVVVAARLASPVFAVEARLGRVRTSRLTRRSAAVVQRDVDASDSAIRRLPPTVSRDRMQAELSLARALTMREGAPHRASLALDTAVAYFDSTHNAVRLLSAITLRAEVRLASGDEARATADLERALAMMVDQRAAITAAAYRNGFVDATRGIVDRLALLRLAGRDTVGALAILEKGRSSLRLTGKARPRSDTLLRVRETAVLDYALVGDTLLAWIVTDRGVTLVRTTVDRDRLLRTAERVRAEMELRAGADALRDDLTQLDAWLIAPLRARIGASGTPIVVVADGEIAGVPFAALFDRRARRYLVEDHAVAFASTLAEAARHADEARGDVPTRTLVVADPLFDQRAYPGLATLPSAGLEADSVAATYRLRGASVAIVRGARADRSGVVPALGHARIVHYAGHAIFDDERPERSFLVLASGRNGADDGSRLTAAEIERLDLGGVRLVVLSACETSRPVPSRSGGFAGLAGAFLTAGAEGVIGSVWRVDDRPTRALMMAFHRAYQTTEDGAGALRAAQLRLLRSTDASLRTPAAWAGFRYTGR